MTQLQVVLGNQLFAGTALDKKRPVFMAESWDLCTHYNYHKQKIALFLTAMRDYTDQLRVSGFEVHYQNLTANRSQNSYFEVLAQFVEANQVKRLCVFEIEDKFFETQMKAFVKKNNLELETFSSPMFLAGRDYFESYLAASKRPFMKTFYEQMRKDHNILMSEQGEPMGGRWSFDQENRKKMPKDLAIPKLPCFEVSENFSAVKAFVEENFADHPGTLNEFHWATTRESARQALECFVQERLEKFGDYQDALHPHEAFNFHSVISPYLNMGLLTPAEVIQVVSGMSSKVPFNSVEGFIRQVLGWREFVRGIYQNFSEEQDTRNFFNHQKKLSACWYTATTGIAVVDDCIRRALQFSYNHHIERLMVLSNLMLLLEVDPREVHRWFMEMYADSSDWVMGPNVYGMGQFSDGGIFATKPYISGSNYILKMGPYKKGEWCDAWDGLFWRFLEKHSEFFKKNHRMNMLLKTLEKMPADKKRRIFSAAQELQKKLTV